MATTTQPSRTISKPGTLPASTTIPSAVAVALFAWLATKAVAKHGFSGSDRQSPAAPATG